MFSAHLVVIQTLHFSMLSVFLNLEVPDWPTSPQLTSNVTFCLIFSHNDSGLSCWGNILSNSGQLLDIIWHLESFYCSSIVNIWPCGPIDTTLSRKALTWCQYYRPIDPIDRKALFTHTYQFHNHFQSFVLTRSSDKYSAHWILNYGQSNCTMCCSFHSILLPSVCKEGDCLG